MLAGALFIGCSKEKKNDTPNQFTYDGKTYALEAGEIEYYGQGTGERADVWNYDITVYAGTEENGQSIYLEMFMDTEAFKPGTYTWSSVYGTLGSLSSDSGVYISNNGGTSGAEFTTGTARVSVSGNIYEITFFCSVGEKPLTGYYKGTLGYFDQSNLE